MRRYLIADVETSGVAKDAKTVELAWVEIDEDLNVLDRVHSLIDPEVPIPASASGVHGITNEDVAMSPTIEEFFSIVLPSLGKHVDGEITLIAHNAVFDKRFLGPHLPGLVGEICTLRLARRTWPDLENHKLQTLIYALKLTRGNEAHSAAGDVEACLDLVRKIVETSGYRLPELAGVAVAPLEVTLMPFGKHKGMPLTGLPKGYIDWLKGIDIDSDLRWSLEKLGR